MLLSISPQTLDTDGRTVPADMRTVLNFMNLTPSTESFVCCPRCFFLYPIGPSDTSPSYPERCTNRFAPDSEPCNRTLRKMSLQTSGKHPVWTISREFVYHGVKDWLARMYSRPEIEKHLDRPYQPLDPNEDPQAEVTDIWDAPELREFLGSDGLPFLERPRHEGRVVFSLNEDGFNPYGNRTAGKKVSSGAIYLVCLNLPPALRYEVENMCLVGVIPGPHEPSLHEMNHLFPPLIRDLKVLWNNGVYFTRTALYPNGRLVKAALVPLVSDLPAARQVAGFSHFSSFLFCHLCQLTLDDLRNLDYKNWPARNFDDHRKYATQWLLAQTEDERDNIYAQHGVRWSIFLELPYWNPIKFTVVDSMHGFYLRMFQHHCRVVWGMDVLLVDGAELSSKQKPKPSDEQMINAHRILRTGSEDQLQTLHSRVLRQLCRECLLHFGGKRRKRWLKDLFAFVRDLARPTLSTHLSLLLPESQARLD